MTPLFIKNILIHILLVPFYFWTQTSVKLLPAEKLDTLLLFVGLIVIAPITSNFLYKYSEASRQPALWGGHVTTFFSMIVVGMLFITLDVLLVFMIGDVLVFRLSLVLFWAALVSFDFADYLNRAQR